MGSLSDDEGECRFFDAPDSISQVSDLGFNCSPMRESSSGIDNGVSYDEWIKTPRSVGERRRQFRCWMGLSLDGMSGEDSVDICGSSNLCTGEIERITERSGAVLRSSIFEDEFLSYQSGLCVEALDSPKQLGSNESFVCRGGNADSGIGCNVHVQAENGQRSNGAIRLERLKMSREPESSPCVSPVIGKLEHGELDKNGDTPKKLNGVKNRLLSRLRSFTCMANAEGRCCHDSMDNSSIPIQRSRIQRVKVHHHKKQLKELSALFMGQDIQAHEGSILTMKFSFDGQYLASAGEDKIVRVWQVIEDERSNEVDIPELDPSCMYFTVNHLSQLAPLGTEKEKSSFKLKGLKKTRDSACVVLPPKVFRILEEPLHVFQGHTGEILDLSWSKNNCLLSSSTDKTVRLWQVGHDLCLGVFSHSNYVTCVQFNPVNDEYFISGSIDGKVRIWAVNSCQVLDWSDIRDIVTAVSYRPDGKGGIIGSMAGSCRFFSLEGHEIQLEEQMCLANKKKSFCKRITGFQFFPQDPSKVMVTCADSHVRILDGIHVIGKYKGLTSCDLLLLCSPGQRTAGNHLCATFTSDGKHIISASEDSNVYVWNCEIPKDYVSQPKVVRSSEFFSSDSSIAIPWSGLKTVNTDNGRHSRGLSQTSNNILPFISSPYLSLGSELFLEAIPRGSATWPEEKLPVSSPRSVSSGMCKSEYKFLKGSCQSSSNSHAWGLVIVTAGYDGRIRSFHNYGLPLPL
ncbi:uncharacterized WD repeat-containing protein alr2800 isoform X2 [Capsicum annuum]|uniref:uncharacterized WD repeat-containing protein alr2800 isoform X2 n=1 Tax=Capsicum annuum TaxID=4072 RepID=UPI0007BF0367|nr:uncharacterized WD repeat-containing protein alr2800 isoform X2 [Capsicum annuum]